MENTGRHNKQVLSVAAKNKSSPGFSVYQLGGVLTHLIVRLVGKTSRFVWMEIFEV